MCLKAFHDGGWGMCCGGYLGHFHVLLPFEEVSFCRINSYWFSFCHHFNDFLLLFPCGHGIGFPGFSRAHVLFVLCLLLTFFASN